MRNIVILFYIGYGGSFEVFNSGHVCALVLLQMVHA